MVLRHILKQDESFKYGGMTVLLFSATIAYGTVVNSNVTDFVNETTFGAIGEAIITQVPFLWIQERVVKG